MKDYIIFIYSVIIFAIVFFHIENDYRKYLVIQNSLKNKQVVVNEIMTLKHTESPGVCAKISHFMNQ